jgi:hypothetical protein
MPKRVIDFDALWASDKIAACPAWAQAEYAWLYGLADASGSFELTNLRVIWGRVAAVRKDLTIERLEQVFREFMDRGLLFTWEAGGKRYGHWTGSDVPGRLPPPSWRARLERLAPPVPQEELAAYMSQFASRGGDWRVPDHDQSATSLASSQNDSQLKLCLEEPQAQGWGREWNSEKERTDTPQCVSSDRHSEISGQQEREQTRTTAEELLEIYERERGALPAAATLTPERRRQCIQRIRAGLKREDFRGAVRLAAATPFLAGEGARGWRASFDWLIANDTNVRKVIEGAYERGPARASPGEMNRALYSELHVGSGPTASELGESVRPETLERWRAFEASRRAGPG